MKSLYNRSRGWIVHPQWLTDRHHYRTRRSLQDLRDCLVLDIGSGNSRSADDLHPSNTLYRIDYPAVNQRYFLRPDVFGDARRLPIADQTLDAALLLEVLEHIGAHGTVLEEIKRTLRPGGLLFLSVPFLYPIHDAPHDFFRFTNFGLRHVLERAGFEIVRQTQNGNLFLVAIQMLNLALLEVCQSAWKKARWLGLLCAALVYPATLLNNVIAAPLTLLPNSGAGAFGYFVLAKRR